MRTKLSKIAQDLEQGTITENEARTFLLTLLGVVVEKGTLCVVCEKRKAGYGYDLHFCNECWGEEKA